MTGPLGGAARRSWASLEAGKGKDQILPQDPAEGAQPFVLAQ